MNKKALSYVLGSEAVVCLAACFLSGALSSAYISAVTFPFFQIALGLRALSLSGGAGNTVAVILYACICLLPLAYFVYRIKLKKYRPEDLLLAAVSILLFITLYFMINPAYISKLFSVYGMADIGMASLSGTVYSVIAGYIVFRLLGSFTESGTAKLLGYLKILLAVLCAALVYSIFGSGICGLTETIKNVRDGNTALSSPLTPTYIFLAAKYIVGSIPAALDVVIIFFAYDLIDELKSDLYGEGVIESAKKLGRICRKSVAAMMLACIAINVAQLFCAGFLLSSNYTIQMPVVSIALTLAVMLLTRYFSEGRKLKTDNDMFI